MMRQLIALASTIGPLPAKRYFSLKLIYRADADV
jgi:hypothetical protein